MRILLVEDNADSREMMSVLLGQAGYEVVTAHSVSDGLELAIEGGFTLIILDNRFKKGSGVGLCRQIRGFDTRTPILFYSGAVYESDIEEAVKAGADAYLIKPVGIEQLEQTITQLLTAERPPDYKKNSEGESKQTK
jgi:DNA-binding response OmpR family regulator